MQRNFFGRARAILLSVLALAALVAAPLPAAAQQSADDVAQLLIEKSNGVIAQLTVLQDEGALDAEAALAIIQTDMSPLLDFERLTRRAMGKHWRKASADQRADIAASFQQLLENTYAKILAQYSGQDVELLSAKNMGEGKNSVVLKISSGEKSAEINYIFEMQDDGASRVTDIKVEGISLVANYRRQFASVIKKDGIDALAEQLQKKADKKAQ